MSKCPPEDELPPGGTEELPVVDNPGETLPSVDPEAPISEEEIVRLLEPSAGELTSLSDTSFSGADVQRSSLDDRMTQVQRSASRQSFSAPGPYSGAAGKEVIDKAPPPPVYQPRWGVWASPKNSHMK